jgi:hypothetical protein
MRSATPPLLALAVAAAALAAAFLPLARANDARLKRLRR